MEAQLQECYNSCENSPLTDQQWLACKAKCRDKFALKVNKTPVSFAAIVEFRTTLPGTTGKVDRFEIFANDPFNPFIPSTNPNFTVNGPKFSDKSLSIVP